jgi:hypothetical protein
MPNIGSDRTRPPAFEVHVRPVAYEVTVWPEDAFGDPGQAMNASEWCVTVARVPGFKGIRWAIYRGGYGSGVCLNRAGDWDREPIPSGRSENWLHQHRFASLEDAIERAKVAAPSVTINGRTALELALDS